jgi:hypothetical protein
LSNYASGWVDWNLLLDNSGGPNHLGNLCDSPVLVNPSGDGVIIQPYLSTISHFSRFLVPGTVIVDLEIKSVYGDEKREYGGPTHMPNGATLALWPCDGSSRQRFSLDDKKLVVEKTQRQRDVGVEVGNGDPEAMLKLCVSNVNNAVGGSSAQVRPPSSPLIFTLNLGE